MKATFLVRNSATSDIEKGLFVYEGPVPQKVWEHYAKTFLKLTSSGYFWPQDEMEAYQEGVAQIARTAERLVRGEIHLVHASPLTYLTNVGERALLNFHQKHVQSARRMYRKIEQATYGVGAVGEDGFDSDNSESENDFEASEMTARELGELLPGVPHARTRIRLARQILDALFLYLSNETKRAFRAYLAADGNFLVAAVLSGIPRATFYRKWPTWVKEARKVGETL